MSKLRVVVVCAILQVGALGGVPMLPDDIRALMNQMNQPTLAHVLPVDEDGGDDPSTGDLREPSRDGERK